MWTASHALGLDKTAHREGGGRRLRTEPWNAVIGKGQVNAGVLVAEESVSKRRGCTIV